MNLPEAEVVHQIRGRLRIRVSSRRGDAAFFDDLAKRFNDEGASAAIRPVTGSILVTGDLATPEWVRDMGARTRTFVLKFPPASPMPAAAHVIAPIASLNRGIRRFTHGELDIFGAVFVVLLTTGIVEIFRGNFRTPPWYTAFWYAFGIFTKSILDHMDTEPPPPAG